MSDPLYPLAWLIVWLLGLLAQALLVNGIYIAAKGSTTKFPDGTDDDSGMILYPIYKYLHQMKKKRYFFVRSMLDVSTLPKMDQVLIMWNDYFIDQFTVRGFRVIGNPDLLLLEKWIKDFYQGELKYDNVNHRIAFYKDENVYRFSKWLRKPTFGCVICMASFWSIFTFVLPVHHFYGWSFDITLLWFADIISLAYVNFLVFKNLA